MPKSSEMIICHTHEIQELNYRKRSKNRPEVVVVFLEWTESSQCNSIWNWIKNSVKTKHIEHYLGGLNYVTKQHQNKRKRIQTGEIRNKTVNSLKLWWLTFPCSSWICCSQCYQNMKICRSYWSNDLLIISLCKWMNIEFIKLTFLLNLSLSTCSLSKEFSDKRLLSVVVTLLLWEPLSFLSSANETICLPDWSPVWNQWMWEEYTLEV